MSSFDRLSHFQNIFDNFLHRPYIKKKPYMDILGPDRGKMTIYGSDFQQVDLTPNGGVSPTDNIQKKEISNFKMIVHLSVLKKTILNPE